MQDFLETETSTHADSGNLRIDPITGTPFQHAINLSRSDDEDDAVTIRASLSDLMELQLKLAAYILQHQN